MRKILINSLKILIQSQNLISITNVFLQLKSNFNEESDLVFTILIYGASDDSSINSDLSSLLGLLDDNSCAKEMHSDYDTHYNVSDNDVTYIKQGFNVD